MKPLHYPADFLVGGFHVQIATIGIDDDGLGATERAMSWLLAKE